MGTEISLDVGGLTIAWSKNHRGIDHGMLFQEKDRQRLRSDQIDYEYFSASNEDPALMETGFCRSLRDMVPRLELLGFTLPRLEREYLERVKVWREQYLELNDESDAVVPDVMTFEELRSFAAAHVLNALDNEFDSSFDDRK